MKRPTTYTSSASTKEDLRLESVDLVEQVLNNLQEHRASEVRTKNRKGRLREIDYATTIIEGQILKVFQNLGFEDSK
ncbi:hypothetical protein HOU02_gp269 [Caulobacter phage CcrBL9]|uniref:Uncharacterized protein n=1 Tax=Caulobacter phage CcrBL9 TaxID=2283270 RepID=A0A385ECP6_9CAUD|nr:hypothetical protein HOU02_gp269 [Caulobacter phage CcrBL9]AXQ69456.1 hypothetical protein CcrBL9_gp432 [Caulobacter phage CcrBL9]